MDCLPRISIILVLVAFSNARYYSHTTDSTDPINVCNIGKSQSPVPLNENDVKYKVLPEIETYFYDLPYSVSLVNTGSTVRVNFEKQPLIPAISGGPLGTRDYLLDQIHFHWESEHTVNGHKFPLEAHFVHYLKKAGNFTNALKINEVVVLTVFLEFSESKPSGGLEEIVKNMKFISHFPNRPVSIKFNPANLLPFGQQKFFSYKGSLTTPGCNEGVQWIIFYERSHISKSHYQILTKIFSSDNQIVKENNRALQPLNGREIYFSVCRKHY